MPIRWRYEARRSKISSAVLVQVEGLGLSFHAAIQSRPGLIEDYDRARPVRCRRLRARRVKAGGCFICGFLAGKRGMDHELLYDDGMWRPLDGSMDGRSDMLPPLDPPGCADRRTCKVNLDDLRWDRPDLDCEFEQARGIRRNLQLDETRVSCPDLGCDVRT